MKHVWKSHQEQHQNNYFQIEQKFTEDEKAPPFMASCLLRNFLLYLLLLLKVTQTPNTSYLPHLLSVSP